MYRGITSRETGVNGRTRETAGYDRKTK